MSDALIAGPEMDAEVDRSVLGGTGGGPPMLWHEYRRDPGPWGSKGLLVCKRCRLYGGLSVREACICAPPPVAPYSSDIASAMVLVEHMRRQWWVKIWEPRKDMWAVTFADHRADSESLPEAICRAALSAMRGVKGGRDE